MNESFAPLSLPIPVGRDASLDAIDLIVDQSGLNRSSRDQPEARHYCREPGCKASFKRKYDIDRHYQAKHVQSKHFFCPVRECKYSVEPGFNELSDELMWGWNWARKPLKAKVLANYEVNGFKRWQLHGFHRKDKLLKHLAKSHKDLGLDLSSLFEEKDACQGDPVVAETQRFWTGKGTWSYTIMGRVQRSDGSWTAWSGQFRNKAAAMDFKAWVSPERPSAIDGSKGSFETYQGSPDPGNASAQASVPSSTPNAGGDMIPLSPGRAVQTVAAQFPLESFSSPYPTEPIMYEPVQTLWGPNQLLNQVEFFPNNDNMSSSIPYSNQIMPSTGIDVEMPIAFEEHNQISTGLMLPMQLPLDHENIAGVSDNLFNSNASFEDTLMDLNMPIDGAHAPAETDQLVPEYLNAGSDEHFESFGEFGFDTATWSSDNGGHQWY